jgi:cation:H+ antiporter
MESFILVISVLVGSFFLLIKSSDYLISSSSILGRRLGISKFVIGLTLVAIGTSLPEFFTAIIGLLTSEDGTSFILGTVMGSNISNILLIFGTLLVFSKHFHSKLEIHNVYILYFSVFLVLLIILFGKINLILTLLLLVSFFLYVYHSIIHSKKGEIIKEVEEIENEESKHSSSFILSLIFIASLLGLNLSARGVVFSIEELGLILDIPLQYLTLTTVALATSLPELVVTYASAKKSEFDLAIGNILGSNISNIFFILGSSGVVSLIVNKPITLVWSDYFFSMLILALTSLLFVIYLKDQELKPYHGILLITLYVFYILYIFN